VIGITTFLNGTLVSNITIDTSQVATDQTGLTAARTRTTHIQSSRTISVLNFVPLTFATRHGLPLRARQLGARHGRCRFEMGQATA
jgi:hypothetical protein